MSQISGELTEKPASIHRYPAGTCAWIANVPGSRYPSTSDITPTSISWLQMALICALDHVAVVPSIEEDIEAVPRRSHVVEDHRAPTEPREDLFTD